MTPAVAPTPQATSPASAASRVRQAARPDNPPDLLRQLARDPDVIVRASLAINGACNPEVDAILVDDADDRVRALLGGRIARLLPNLDAADQGVAADHIVSTLTVLARDHAVRVRAVIADEIKSMKSAPRDLVMLLAQDAAVEVSAPILRLSPVLTDNDLVQLLATPPSPGAAASIASRPAVSAAVADAIVAYADAPAIRILLANQSACIQEATLDALVGRAPSHVDWHPPLVRRPNLSAHAVRALSEFIAVDLLRILAARPDLDQHKLEIVRQRLADEAAREDEAMIWAEGQRLKASQGLTERLMLQAAEASDARRLAVFLAVASDVSVAAVDRVVELRSAKALVSLVWRSGFSMRVGIAVQTTLANFAPDHVLLPTVNGGFPLTREEMEWQLELMCEDEIEAHATGPNWSGK